MYYLWNIEVNIETHTLDGACLGLIFSIFTAAVDYCTYSGSASLSHPMMDRCKSSQSCSDSPISPNLICLKNAALTLYSLVSPLLSSSTFRFPFYYTFFPHSVSDRGPFYFTHTFSLPTFAALCSFPIPSLPLSPFLPFLSHWLVPVSHLKALSYLLEWKSSFTICLI